MLNAKAKMLSARQRLTNQFGDNPDAVFVWIPKSAGTSLYGSLAKLGCPKLKTEARIKRVFPQKGLVTFVHLDYRALVDAGLVSAAFDQRARKFTIVRDPYDRAVSLYFYILNRHRLFENWHVTPSFQDFLELIDKGFYDRIGIYNEIGMSQANPQVAWTRGITFDLVGRLETLDEAIRDIGTLLGKPLPAMEWLNKNEKKLPDGLFTKETIYLIDKIYDEDFSTFGYDRRPA